jgi:hypothetical protein
LWVETGLSEQLSAADPTWEQVEIAERVIAVPEEEEITTFAARRLEVERTEVPVVARRRVLRRDEL